MHASFVLDTLQQVLHDRRSVHRGGLVHIACIERNAIDAMKAVKAARLTPHVPEQARVILVNAEIRNYS